MESEENSPKILKLPENVINLIAAGEVIQRPANAVKELIENSLDAGATEIRITVKSGGTKYLQVQDNGSGIQQSDLELLCQRYSTSKLRQMDDLKSISTHGFRGEALASISQVSHLAIVTKTASSVLGFRANYEGGRLKEKPKPCACNRGTQITAEDLFYNMTERRQALKSAGEEMKKIADVVGKYAVNNSRVAFTLKKHGEAMLDIRTTGGGGVGGGPVWNEDSCSIRTAIGLIYGSPLSKELLQFRCDDPTLAFEARGYATNPTYSAKKFTFILFINNRLVECQALKRSLESLYSNYGPAKSVSPFIYAKIDIDPQNVDVNVHPTKHAVKFLHEKEIVATLETAVRKTLDKCNVSKTFLVKSFPTTSNESIEVAVDDDSRRKQTSDGNAKSQKKSEPHSMVRTDGRGRRLEEFFDSQNSPASSQNIRVNFVNFVEKPDEDGGRKSTEIVRKNNGKSNEAPSTSHITNEDISVLYEDVMRQQAWRPITLASIVNLQKIVKDRCSVALRSLIADHTFVGCLDPEFAMIQHATGLYLVNTTTLSREFFYQILVFQFGNLGALQLSEKCRLTDLICLAMPSSIDQSSRERRQKAQEYSDLLMARSEMLWDYFSLQLVDGYLMSIPWLLPKYVPQLEGLPDYIYRLATIVDWETEDKCFETFCRETSRFYAFKKNYCDGDKAANFSDAAQIDWKTMLETVLYPGFKSKLIPPATFDDSKTIMKLTDVHDLYKVFERC